MTVIGALSSFRELGEMIPNKRASSDQPIATGKPTFVYLSADSDCLGAAVEAASPPGRRDLIGWVSTRATVGIPPAIALVNRLFKAGYRFVSPICFAR